jgi:hypothetical protein
MRNDEWSEHTLAWLEMPQTGNGDGEPERERGALLLNVALAGTDIAAIRTADSIFLIKDSSLIKRVHFDHRFVTLPLSSAPGVLRDVPTGQAEGRPGLRRRVAASERPSVPTIPTGTGPRAGRSAR